MHTPSKPATTVFTVSPTTFGGCIEPPLLVKKGQLVAVLGVSANANEYAFKVLRGLAVKGHTPIPVNPLLKEVDGLFCYPDLLTCPKGIETVTVYVKPKILADLLEDILDVKPKRVILNPGSECEAAVVILKAAGIEVVKACTLVMLCGDQF